MIAVVSVHFNAPEFAELLIESIERTRSELVQVILCDNSYCWSPPLPSGRFQTLKPLKEPIDRTHGAGLNRGVAWACDDLHCDEVLILDIDCHFLQRGWESAFRQKLQGSHCVTVAGSPEKPIRPACCFLKTLDACTYDWRATPGYQGHRVTPEGFDVGILAYHKMIAQGRTVQFMDTTKQNRYGTETGEEYGIDGEMLVYHHWHGTHLEARQVDYEVDLIEGRDQLFRSIPWRKKVKIL